MYFLTWFWWIFVMVTKMRFMMTGIRVMMTWIWITWSYFYMNYIIYYTFYRMNEGNKNDDVYVIDLSLYLSRPLSLSLYLSISLLSLSLLWNLSVYHDSDFPLKNLRKLFILKINKNWFKFLKKNLTKKMKKLKTNQNNILSSQKLLNLRKHFLKIFFLFSMFFKHHLTKLSFFFLFKFYSSFYIF